MQARSRARPLANQTNRIRSEVEISNAAVTRPAGVARAVAFDHDRVADTEIRGRFHLFGVCSRGFRTMFKIRVA